MVPAEERHRYTGAGNEQRFLDDARTVGPEVSALLAGARPAGPCATTAGTDTWTDQPYVDGVVLVGDAAGHNDPIAGCGLSIAMRDALIVRDLILGGARTAAEFAPYGAERTDRMRRLRMIADVLTAASVVPGPDRTARRQRFDAAMAAMDPEVFPVVLGMFAGPETVPAQLVTAAAVP